MAEKMITLRSSDGETFEITETVAVESQLIKHMVEDVCADNEIPVPIVTGSILAKVIEYCKKHVEAAGKTEDKTVEEDLKTFDTEFVTVDQDTLIDLILAANYLEIESLLDLTCRAVASMFLNKTPDEIRTHFNIKNDYTKVEEEAIRKKYVWAFDEAVVLPLQHLKQTRSVYVMDPKTSKQKVLDESKDRLSNLRETVLPNILAYLGTTTVVRSTVLSKKWEDICSLVNDIDLNYSIPESIRDQETVRREALQKSFLQFVDEFFHSRGETRIRRMVLESAIPVERLRLRNWIEAAVNNNVQYVDVNLIMEEEQEVVGMETIPNSLYTCDTLIVLKLKLNCILSPPQNTRLPELEKLSLEEVVFKDDQTFQHLFSKCPLLNKLALVVCNWDGIDNVSVSVPELESLEIEGDATIDVDECVVKIDAPKLGCLEFKSYLDVDFDLVNLCSLKTAFIDLPCDSSAYDVDDIDDVERRTRALKLFLAIDKVETLNISVDTIKYLKGVEAFVDEDWILDKLTLLTVDSGSKGIKASDCVFLLSLLGKMPHLKDLDLGKVSCKDENTSFADDLMHETVPSCFNSGLRSFTFGEFLARENEMVLVEYVMKNATCLENLSISCSKLLQKENFSTAHARLQCGLWGSDKCKLDFSYEK